MSKDKSSEYLDDESLLKWLKLKAKREGSLFFSLCENGNRHVEKEDLKAALAKAGLQPNDPRLTSLFYELEHHDDVLQFDDFVSIIRTPGLLVEKALRGELALPDFTDLSKISIKSLKMLNR